MWVGAGLDAIVCVEIESFGRGKGKFIGDDMVMEPDLWIELMRCADSGGSDESWRSVGFLE